MKTYKLGKIELVNIDLSPDGLDFKTAKDFIKKFDTDKRWRFPSVLEFYYLKKLHDLGLCRFSSDYYWTSDKSGEGIFVFDFTDGIPYLDDSTEKSLNRVRLVRNI